ncbi:MAG TPA: hypothetical protein VHB98_24405 [Chloroflexota bacterium]|nr:hypothetical protein [Chloroflexota bacterium]
MRPRWIAPSLLALVLSVGASLSPAVPGAAARAVKDPVQWLRVDPLQPSTVYVGLPGGLVRRSMDGGATWQYLRSGVSRGAYADSCDDSTSTATIALGGHALYIYYAQSTDPVCRTGIGGVVRSRDMGLTYEDLGSDTDFTLADPLLAQRLYRVSGTNGGDYLSEATCDTHVYTRGSADQHWQKRGDPTAGTKQNPLSQDTVCFDLVDTPQQPATVYAITSPVMRSEDAGLTWTTVVTPTAVPALKHFAVRYDPSAGSLLEGFTDDAGVPKDRVFFSSDQGRTWTSGTCAGDHHGACPTIMLQNVLGAGASYAVFKDGIYAFHGTGPAGARLALTAGWPFPLAQIEDMQSGTHAGDPVYVRLRDGRVYGSADSGHSWRLLDAGHLPTSKPVTPVPGALRAGPYGYAVDPRFIATYRKLGSLILGYPIDQPYSDGHTFVQDFEHLRLTWQAGHVSVDDLGSEAASYSSCGFGSTDDPNSFCSNNSEVKPVPNTSARRYFPRTGHIVSGDLLRFWQQHGGAAVLGLPLTEVYRAQNGDATNRAYQMQLFTKARLERHPETHTARYAILLGLLGPEVLRERGWLPAS